MVLDALINDIGLLIMNNLVRVILWLVAGFFAFVVFVIGATWKVATWASKVSSLEFFLINADKKLDILVRSNASKADQTVHSGSPVQLTARGKKISKAAEVGVWAEQQAREIVESGDAFDKEEYEVFDLCVDRVRSQIASDKQLEKDIHRTSYNEGVAELFVVDVYNVELRDQVLKQVKRQMRAT